MTQNDWMTIFQIITPIMVVIIASIIPIFLNLVLSRVKNKNDIQRSINQELLEQLYIPMTKILEYTKETPKTFNTIAKELRCLFSEQSHLVEERLLYALEEFEMNLENDEKHQPPFEKIKPLLLLYFQNYNVIRYKLGYPYSISTVLYNNRKNSAIIWGIYKNVIIASAIGYSLYYFFNFYYYQIIPVFWKLLYIPEYILAIYTVTKFKNSSLRQLNDLSYIEEFLSHYELMYLKI